MTTSPMDKLLHHARLVLRRKHYAYRTEKQYLSWIRRFMLFHTKRHPKHMGEKEVEFFLTHLAVKQNVAASTQNQALNALLFLYRDVLLKPLDLSIHAVRARRPKRMPSVLSLRASECARLRVKDLDFAMSSITVRDGKGQKDRVTLFPESLIEPLKIHLQRVHAIHRKDLRAGLGAVHLPYALERKYPNANREWTWQYVFPSPRLTTDPRSGLTRRHHLSTHTLQTAVRKAARLSGLQKRVTCHTFRHSFATHLLEAGYDIRTVQDLLGHKDVKTTMIYTHVLKKGPMAVRSPLDRHSDE
jgi:site-specific recombinase XerD